MRLSIMAVQLMTCVLLVACSTSVERLGTNEVRDLSGSWNDTDSRLVSEEMINDLLSRPWYGRFTDDFNKEPTVIVGTVRNMSHEHINTTTFINDIERALINSGKVELIAGGDMREQLRTERAEQDVYASTATRKKMGAETGADTMLLGTISTIVDKEGSKQVRFYQVDLRLVDIETNRMVWSGQKKIKKYIKDGLFR